MLHLTRYLDRHLRGHIDFETFHLLAIIPRSGKDAVVLLIPRDPRKDQYSNLQCGSTSLWYSSLEHMLMAAKEYYGIPLFALGDVDASITSYKGEILDEQVLSSSRC